MEDRDPAALEEERLMRTLSAAKSRQHNAAAVTQVKLPHHRADAPVKSQTAFKTQMAVPSQKAAPASNAPIPAWKKLEMEKAEARKREQEEETRRKAELAEQIKREAAPASQVAPDRVVATPSDAPISVPEAKPIEEETAAPVVPTLKQRTPEEEARLQKEAEEYLQKISSPRKH